MVEFICSLLSLGFGLAEQWHPEMSVSQFLNWWWKHRNFAGMFKSGVCDMWRIHQSPQAVLFCGRTRSGSGVQWHRKRHRDLACGGPGALCCFWGPRRPDARVRMQLIVMMPDEGGVETQTSVPQVQGTKHYQGMKEGWDGSASPLTVLGRSTVLQYLEVCLLGGTLDSDLKAVIKDFCIVIKLTKFVEPHYHSTIKLLGTYMQFWLIAK